MVKLILSDRNRHQLAELSMASNIVYKKALDSQGYCQFDLFLSDPMATPKYINPSNYVHVFSDTADSTNYSEAQWGGPLVDDYKINPKQGIITCMAAGMANLLEMSILSTTANFTVGTAQDAINGILNISDNSLASLGLTPYTTQPNSLFPTINNFVGGWGDSVLEDIYKICQDYALDFDVRPDWTYAILNRQGVDNPHLVIRYGDQGNIQVDTNFKLVNQELANKVTFLDNSGNAAYVVNQTSINYYGAKSILIQDGETYAQEDALTKAQLYAARAAFPLNLLDNVTVFDNYLLPFDQIRVGDSVVFEAPSLPLLQAYNGLQRILSVEYNDRKRTMTLTLGNAIYKVTRNHLHEVRLYGNGGATWGSIGG